MGIFSQIKNAIFGRPHPQAASSAAAPPAAATSATTAGTPAGATPISTTPAAPPAGSPAAPPAASPAPAVPAAPTPMSEVDVEAILDSMEGADRLNWRVSIADLMRLLGLDPSFARRKELAHELGDADYSGTAEENVWLHRQVMNKLAESGGKVPESLRD